MRISSALYFQTGVNTLNKQESELLHLFQQIGTGRRMITPADDPLAAAQSITLAQSQSMNQRFKANREVAMQALGESENVLNNVVNQLVDLKTRLIEASNATLSDQDRASLAHVLSQSQETLLGTMNATDASGYYLFSGSKSTSVPFSLNEGRYVYQGDKGEIAARNVRIEHSRILNVGNAGNDVFLRAAPGTVAFLSASTKANQGSAVLGAMQIHDTQKASQVQDVMMTYVDGDQEQWQLQVHYRDEEGKSAVATYDLAADSSTLRVDLQEEFGLSFEIRGTPEVGDQVSYHQVQFLNGSDELNILNVLSEVVEALEQPIQNNSVAAAHLHNTLNRAIQAVDIAYDNVLTVQASIGSRMNELESLHHSGDLQALQLAKELSRLEDVDYYTASSQLALRKMALEAASVAFMKIQGTSLFSMGK